VTIKLSKNCQVFQTEEFTGLMMQG